MASLGFDPRPWNIGASFALSAAACGPLIASEDTDGGTAGSSGETSVGSVMVTSLTSSSDPTTIGPDCRGGCPPNYTCIDGICVYDCDTYCCEDVTGCCGMDCGLKDCYSSHQCEFGEVCEYGACSPAEPLPACADFFGTPFELPLPSTGDVYSLKFIDADGDVQKDLLVGGGSNLRLIRGAEPDSAEILASEGTVLTTAVGDIDGDGDQDIAFTITGSSLGVGVLRNDGGTFVHTDTDLTGAPSSVLIADIDFDGNGDVLVGTEGGLRYLRSEGSGELSSGTLAYPGLASQLVSGDFDGDGLIDTGIQESETFVLNGGEQFFVNGLQNSVQVAPSSVALVAADFEANGIVELARLDAVDGSYSVLTSWPAWSLLQPAQHVVYPGGFSSATTGDLDGNSAAEIVILAGTPDLGVVVGGGVTGGMFFCSATIKSPLSVWVAAVGDLSGDGRNDVVVSDGGGLVALIRAD